MYVEGTRKELEMGVERECFISWFCIAVSFLFIVAGAMISHHEKTLYGFLIVTPSAIVFGSMGVWLRRPAIAAIAKLKAFNERFPKCS